MYCAVLMLLNNIISWYAPETAVVHSVITVNRRVTSTNVITDGYTGSAMEGMCVSGVLCGRVAL